VSAAHKTWRLLALAAFLVIAAVAFFFLPVQQALVDFIEWVREFGFWGPVLVAVVYIPATVFFVPGTILSLGAGYAFGVVVGTITISVGSTLGAAAAFWCGRTIARSLIEDRIKSHPRFLALDQAVAAEGFKIVLLTRLSPVFPFNFLNYAFGLTQVRFRDYFLASWIGMLPGTVMYVYLGTLAGELADLASGGPRSSALQYALLGAGLVATVAVTVVITRLASRVLARAAPAVVSAPTVERTDDHNEPTTAPRLP
jgi:uncharacterized membrane protein YdjX (TVP38/TMEM64 family)